jgi:hypothetical protein
MKLEKFDLEKAINGAKVVTRDGREVTQLTKFESVKRLPSSRSCRQPVA